MNCNFNHTIQADLKLLIIWEKSANSPDEYFTRSYIEQELQALALQTQIKLEEYANKIAKEQAIRFSEMFNEAQGNINE